MSTGKAKRRGSSVGRSRTREKPSARDLVGKFEDLARMTVEFGTERLLLKEQVLKAEGELNRRRTELARVTQRLTDIEIERQRLTERYIEAEERNGRLESLYVASCQLHESRDQRELMSAIQEIIGNLIGACEFAVFQVTADGLSLSLLSHCGIDPVAYATVPLGLDTLGNIILSGEPYVAEEPGGDGEARREAGLTACVPFVVGDRVTGGIAIFGLSPPKAGLDSFDRELLSLVASHAARALSHVGVPVMTDRTGDFSSPLKLASAS